MDSVARVLRIAELLDHARVRAMEKFAAGCEVLNKTGVTEVSLVDVPGAWCEGVERVTVRGHSDPEWSLVLMSVRPLLHAPDHVKTALSMQQELRRMIRIELRKEKLRNEWMEILESFSQTS